MKFYIPANRIYLIEDFDCEMLTEADYDSHKRAITLCMWSNGWIYETDDGFDTYFTLVTGYRLPTVTDDEYNQYIMDKITFLSKERAKQFRSAWTTFQPKRLT